MFSSLHAREKIHLQTTIIFNVEKKFFLTSSGREKEREKKERKKTKYEREKIAFEREKEDSLMHDVVRAFCFHSARRRRRRHHIRRKILRLLKGKFSIASAPAFSCMHRAVKVVCVCEFYT